MLFQQFTKERQNLEHQYALGTPKRKASKECPIFGAHQASNNCFEDRQPLRQLSVQQLFGEHKYVPKTNSKQDTDRIDFDAELLDQQPKPPKIEIVNGLDDPSKKD